MQLIKLMDDTDTLVVVTDETIQLGDYYINTDSGNRYAYKKIFRAMPTQLKIALDEPDYFKKWMRKIIGSTKPLKAKGFERYHPTNLTVEEISLLLKTKNLNSMIDRELALFLRWLLQHYSTATIDVFFGYVDSMGKEVDIKTIIDHYNKGQEIEFYKKELEDERNRIKQPKNQELQNDCIECDYCSKVVKKFMAIDVWMITDDNKNVCYECQMKNHIGYGEKKNLNNMENNLELEMEYSKELSERREIAINYNGQVAGRHPDMFGNSEMRHMIRGYLEGYDKAKKTLFTEEQVIKIIDEVSPNWYKCYTEEDKKEHLSKIIQIKW